MPEHLTHEAMTEPHDFIVRFPLGIKVGAALRSSHRKGGQGILEDLLKPQKLENAQVDRRMEAKAALVGAYRAVHLNPVTPVDLYLTPVIHPGNSKHYNPLRLNHALKYLRLAIFRMLLQYRRHRLDYL